MKLIDTHTHIYYEQDLEKRALQIQNCLDNGINQLYLPNVDLASAQLIEDMTAAYSGMCFGMLGLHPCEVKANYEEILQALYTLISTRKIYAIGEIGIDLFWDKTTLDIQKHAFNTQIQWAKELDLPFVIHCREAFDEVFAVLKDAHSSKMSGIFHCFTGNETQALEAIDLGFVLGIGGVVTYKNGGLDKFLKNIPLEKIVLETDAPYLTPVPFRGKPNQSSYLIYIAQKVAEIYGISVPEVGAITSKNAALIFRND